ncbi:hydantoinase B/oxoprolinase family protein [Paeniglutamicibacter sp. ABSL32-1]|uniref:hydantoinase B/oxoprolinase family protein n=1 Tax=Paeniglutamicibacter quisquiliarum TaxID=2849498 RepID=UPI001C2D2E70|nr:hydantoinase B/oxoprolinase family protein [Paeniglutamicibacter quisquiliarum]MBV1780076.1 hydantoinase B/oxoprolinase family protein [Paeniglutamicibacter quisquiliarum]
MTTLTEHSATAREPEVDTVTFEVLSSALTSIAEEMGVVLKRSSYSPIIRDMDDFSCALFTADGDLVAQADYIPAQLGAMSLVVKAIIERWDGRISDGDAFICNHPFLGAMHLPDVNVVTPIFVDGILSGWSGTAAHHIDVGGVNPGSEGPELEDIFAEGLILPPVRLSIAGVENPDVISIITDNIRDPLSTVSDLRAQRAACVLGYQRLNELAGQYGLAVVSSVMRRNLDVVELAVRNALLDLPDGEGEAEGFLDDDGLDGPPTRIHAKVSKVGDTLHIDLSGSSAQVRGAMNVPWASARAGIVYAVRAVVAPDLGSNDGLLRAVDINAPLGSVLNPMAPAAVSIRHNTCQRFADTLIRALTDIWPEAAVGSSTVSFFCMNVGSTSPVTGRPAVMADVVGGGTGATGEADGLDGVDTYMSNVGVMPAEVVETNYRIRILRNEFVPGSQGTGRFNGGLGLRREYEILEHPQRATFYAEQTKAGFAPTGASGGSSGQPTRITLISPDGTETMVKTKTSTTLQPGTIVRVETAGGGGFGPASERSEAARESDERNGLLAFP